jgi:DNA-binding transcriptional ArsR family regulator
MTWNKNAIRKDPAIRYDRRRIDRARQKRIIRERSSKRRQRFSGFLRNRNDPSSSEAFTNWWVHLWSGLVRDQTGKHYKAIRKAIWLYLYFLVTANWRDGTLFRRVDTILQETGFKQRSVQRWISVLRKRGYIDTRHRGRAMHISISRWRPISRKIRSRTDKPV